MRALKRLLGFLRPHAVWVAAAAVSMAGVALALVFMVSLAGPLFEIVLGSGVEVPGLAAATGKEGGKSGGGVAKFGFAKAVDTWFDDALEVLRAFVPADAAAVLLLVFVAIVAKNLLTYLGHYSFYRAGLATVKDLRDRLMDALLGQSARFYQKRPSAVLMSRLTNDVEQITFAVSDRLSELFQDGFTLAGLAVYLFTLNLPLALVVFVGAPVVVWPIAHFARKLRRRSYQTQERLGEMNAVADEVLKGWRVVQAFGMQPFEARRFRGATRQHFRASLRARKIVALNAPVVEVLGAAGVMALLYYANRQISGGVTTSEAFLQFLIGLYSMYQPIKRLNKVNLALQGAIAASERVFEVIDEPVEITDRTGAVKVESVREAIRFDNVAFSYEPGKTVLRSFTLEIPAGRSVALVGPSGAGKSTIAQMLPRFWDVEGGRITIDGVDVRDIELRSLRAMLGLVTQETVLFNDTVRANIAYGRDEVDESRVLACAGAAFADEFIRELPRGYDTVVGEAGVRLSGGQRQRIAVARALYKDPPLLILDEATSALDAESEAVVQRALENLMRGRTSLIIAHRLATVRNADVIAVMNEGRVVEQGTHAELLARGGLYAHLADLQGIRE
ncbi:MAG: ABC transporter ATP-binding protein [Acidobacteriota bacterium]